jgi:hypothetical protein
MAKTAMEKQDMIIAQFMNIARNANRSTVKTITQQLIEEGQSRKAEREKMAQAAKEAPRYASYYGAKYAAEAAAERKAASVKPVGTKNRK